MQFRRQKRRSSQSASIQIACWASLLCGVFVTGCAPISGPLGSISEPLSYIRNQLDCRERTDAIVIGWRNRALGSKAWKRDMQAYHGSKYARHIRSGFSAGYNNVANGGEGCPPELPPEEYWGWQYQTAEGQAKIHAWYEGFPLGAASADRDGIGNYVKLPLYVNDCPLDMIPPPPVRPEGVPPANDQECCKLLPPSKALRDRMPPTPFAPTPTPATEGDGSDDNFGRGTDTDILPPVPSTRFPFGAQNEQRQPAGSDAELPTLSPPPKPSQAELSDPAPPREVRLRPSPMLQEQAPLNPGRQNRQNHQSHQSQPEQVEPVPAESFEQLPLPADSIHRTPLVPSSTPGQPAQRPANRPGNPSRFLEQLKSESAALDLPSSTDAGSGGYQPRIRSQLPTTLGLAQASTTELTTDANPATVQPASANLSAPAALPGGSSPAPAPASPAPTTTDSPAPPDPDDLPLPF